MARTPRRNGFAKMRNVIADRAALALDRGYPGAHRDKRIARDFGISTRTAQYLRAGQCWTMERLAQASSILGSAFDRALYVPVSSVEHDQVMGELSERLAQLEARVDEVVRRDDARPTPPQSHETYEVGGTAREGSAPAYRGGSRS